MPRPNVEKWWFQAANRMFSEAISSSLFSSSNFEKKQPQTSERDQTNFFFRQIEKSTNRISPDSLFRQDFLWIRTKVEKFSTKRSLGREFWKRWNCRSEKRGIRAAIGIFFGVERTLSLLVTSRALLASISEVVWPLGNFSTSMTFRNGMTSWTEPFWKRDDEILCWAKDFQLTLPWKQRKFLEM